MLARSGFRTFGVDIMADAVHDAERFHALLEAQIRRIPEQYLWMHRRFKGLSPDYPDYYGQDTRRRQRAQETAT